MKKIILSIFSVFLLTFYSHASTVEEYLFEGYKEIRIYNGEYGSANTYKDSIASKWALPGFQLINGTWMYIEGGYLVEAWLKNNPQIVLGYEMVCGQISSTDSVCGQKPIYNVSSIPGYYTGTLLSNGSGLLYNSYFVSISSNYSVVDGELVIQEYVNILPPTTDSNSGSQVSNTNIVAKEQDCSNPDFTNKTNASICLVGQIIPGCKISSPNYITSINTPAGNVGLTSVDLKITCSNGVNYHIMPIHENISVQGTDETLKLTGWKDGGRGDKLTPLSAKVQSGNGSEQSIPIYFTLEGKGKSTAYGNTIVNPFVGSISYPIQINY